MILIIAGIVLIWCGLMIAGAMFYIPVILFGVFVLVQGIRQKRRAKHEQKT